MSSKKSSKADLLVRVRYQNQLPPPPFPPKLLIVETTPARYANYDFLLPLAAERELPMVVDAELGMPLELGKNDDAYWNGDFSVIAPDPANKPALHEDDLALLVEPAGAVSATATGMLNPSSHLTSATNLPAIDRKKAEVSWLRRTEYLAAEGTPRREVEAKPTPIRAAKKRRTRLERISAINKTFEAASKPIEDLRHPTRRDLVALEEFPILPDDMPRDRPFNLLRFTDDPVEKRPADTEVHFLVLEPEQRSPIFTQSSEIDNLAEAFFRIVEIPDDPTPRVTLYYPKDVAQVREYKLRHLASNELPPGEEAEYRMQRDFEPHGAARELRNEYLLCFDDPLKAAQDAMFEEEQPVERQKAAYISPLSSIQPVRKRRAQKVDRDRGGYGEAAAEQDIVLWHNLRVAWYEGADALAEAEDEREAQERQIDPNPDDDPMSTQMTSEMGDDVLRKP